MDLMEQVWRVPPADERIEAARALTIQSALDMARAGGMIVLLPGTHKVEGLTFDRHGVKLIGEDGAIVDPGQDTMTITVNADFCTVKNIHFLAKQAVILGQGKDELFQDCSWIR